MRKPATRLPKQADWLVFFGFFFEYAFLNESHFGTVAVDLKSDFFSLANPPFFWPGIFSWETGSV